MGHTQRLAAKSGFCLVLTLLTVSFGCSSSFTSSSDAQAGASGSSADAGASGSSADAGASVGEEAGAGGDAGVSTGGTGGSSAGAGGVLGLSGSGAGGSSGALGHAGKSGDCGECLVANQCLDHCGGTVVYTGCCACVAPAINKNTCPKI
jgi:hypothetical protein